MIDRLQLMPSSVHPVCELFIIYISFILIKPVKTQLFSRELRCILLSYIEKMSYNKIVEGGGAGLLQAPRNNIGAS